MARVHKNFIDAYPSMSLKELHKPVIFVVDMVNGFVKEGALHDTEINEVSENIIEIIRENEHRVIFIRDCHPQTTREFLSYPSHCLCGTSESEIIDELKPYVYEEMCKNSTNTFTCPDFQEFLETRIYDYQDIVITGCCTDICILQFALCLNAWLNEHNEDEKRIIIPIDCVDTYHIEGSHDAVAMNEFSIQNMAANGIHMISHLERRES